MPGPNHHCCWIDLSHRKNTFLSNSEDNFPQQPAKPPQIMEITTNVIWNSQQVKRNFSNGDRKRIRKPGEQPKRCGIKELIDKIDLPAGCSSIFKNDEVAQKQKRDNLQNQNNSLIFRKKGLQRDCLQSFEKQVLAMKYYWRGTNWQKPFIFMKVFGGRERKCEVDFSLKGQQRFKN